MPIFGGIQFQLTKNLNSRTFKYNKKKKKNTNSYGHNMSNN